ncbi:hypothetical protein NPIL_375601 [Nephila pilipes]|uniref:Uncharacterized protein n=1 Tax=Nephila pilipes TaxID=299642 RepID=A0A8X6MVS3_NEPPI|nr:hypothetical protein NPIL_375601 [Nephila pilipes]
MNSIRWIPLTYTGESSSGSRLNIPQKARLYLGEVFNRPVGCGNQLCVTINQVTEFLYLHAKPSSQQQKSRLPIAKRFLAQQPGLHQDLPPLRESSIARRNRRPFFAADDAARSRRRFREAPAARSSLRRRAGRIVCVSAGAPRLFLHSFVIIWKVSWCICIRNGEVQPTPPPPLVRTAPLLPSSSPRDNYQLNMDDPGSC